MSLNQNYRLTQFADGQPVNDKQPNSATLPNKPLVDTMVDLTNSRFFQRSRCNESPSPSPASLPGDPLQRACIERHPSVSDCDITLVDGFAGAWVVRDEGTGEFVDVLGLASEIDYAPFSPTVMPCLDQLEVRFSNDGNWVTANRDTLIRELPMPEPGAVAANGLGTSVSFDWIISPREATADTPAKLCVGLNKGVVNGSSSVNTRTKKDESEVQDGIWDVAEADCVIPNCHFVGVLELVQDDRRIAELFAAQCRDAGLTEDYIIAAWLTCLYGDRGQRRASEMLQIDVDERTRQDILTMLHHHRIQS